MSTTTVSTFDKLNPFKGATAHAWLIFLKDFSQCLNNSGLASINGRKGLDGKSISDSRRYEEKEFDRKDFHRFLQ